MTSSLIFKSTLIHSVGRCAPLQRGSMFVLFALTNLALMAQVKGQAVQNTFYGNGAGAKITYGSYNSGFGDSALNADTSGGSNTAIGVHALYKNDTGYENTATGDYALNSNNGSANTANGVAALYFNTTGSNNTANGDSALYSNSIGSNNTANGFQALFSNTTGTYNTADGVNALYNNNTGYWNVAIGANAGKNLTTGSGNVCIGVNVLGLAGESNTTRIRNVYSSAASARAVYVNADNKIGTLSSSRRFKEEIKPMDKASEAILALKPITFRYKKEVDPAPALSFGLIAEEVEKVSPDLVTRDDEGKPETVRYEAVNAMLLNEFLKEHRKVEEQKCKIQQQQATIAEIRKDFRAAIAQLTARLEEQAEQIQKVRAQLEVREAASQAFVNNE